MSVERGPVRGSGKRGWKVRWRELDGRQRSRTFETKADAQTFDDDLRRRRRLGPAAVAQLTGGGLTLHEWMRDNWRPQHSAAIEGSTLRTYDRVWRAHIEHSLGALPIVRVDGAQLRRWQARTLAGGASSPTIRKCRTVISSVLRHAAEEGAIEHNAVSIVRPPRREQVEAVQPLAPVMVEAIRRELLALAPSAGPERQLSARRDATMVSVLAYAGLRPGELRALRWGDLHAVTLTITRAADDLGEVKGTKTKNIGTVRLLAPLVADLDALRQQSHGPGQPARNELIFPGPSGGPMSKSEWDEWRSARWARACRRAGMRPVQRPYDLRHSFVSLLLAEGRTVHYVAQQARNTPRQILDTYGHLVAEFADGGRIVADDEIFRARSNTTQGVAP